MQAEKERIIQVIQAMPANKLRAVIDAVDEIDSDMIVDPMGPEELMVKNEDDFCRLVQRGLDDIKAGRVYTLEEARAITAKH